MFLQNKAKAYDFGRSRILIRHTESLYACMNIIYNMSAKSYIIVGMMLSFVILALTLATGISYGLIQPPNLNFDVSQDAQVVNTTSEVSSEEELVNNTLRGVVTIYTQESGELKSQGSGFIYKDDYIMSNEHVVRGASNYYIKYKEDDWGEAELVGSDEDTDIAILEYDTAPDYVKSLPMQINLPNVGQRVISLGAPNGLDSTVTNGIISGTERSVKIGTQFSIPDTIQTDTALNKGNSGGPLVSLDNGAVVGVNRATEGENIGYAVSSRIANHVGTKIINKGYHQHSYLGIRTVTLTPIVREYGVVEPDNGLVVRDVIERTPADEVLNSNVSNNNTTQDNPDVIVGIEGEDVEDNEDLASYLMRNTEPGDVVTISVYRDGNLREIDVQLTSREGSNTPN